ncbi:hypothetical protein EVAR_35642_1 [Eumeta japonica]|uniref:Uncharacterized protein n=1 Tax=Eumeta variegata TaxID=151549 RepID=A0A4C1WDR2_EUMVA|nr:hypothetical protein EVAR_35642_1 [Eumeta japonica]
MSGHERQCYSDGVVRGECAYVSNNNCSLYSTGTPHYCSIYSERDFPSLGRSRRGRRGAGAALRPVIGLRRTRAGARAAVVA